MITAQEAFEKTSKEVVQAGLPAECEPCVATMTSAIVEACYTENFYVDIEIDQWYQSHYRKFLNSLGFEVSFNSTLGLGHCCVMMRISWLHMAGLML